MKKMTIRKTWMKLAAGTMSAALIFGCNVMTPAVVRADATTEVVGGVPKSVKKDAAQTTKVEVKVTDKDGKVLEGAKIGLFEESVTKYTEENSKAMKSTDEKGIATFTDVAAGTYQIVQMDKADGYKISDTVYMIVINSEGNVENVYEKGDADHTKKELTFTNEKETTTVDDTDPVDVDNPDNGDDGDLAEVEPFQFTLVDKDGNPLKGGTFAIFNKDADTDEDTPLATAKSDEDGIVMFTSIKTPGEYIIVQTKAPDGYEASDIVLVAVLNEDGTVNPLYEKGDKEQNEVIEVVNTKEISKLTPSTSTGRSATTAKPISTSGKKTLNAQKLPETGREQVAVYVGFGAALIALGAGLWLTKGRRKYEK